MIKSNKRAYHKDWLTVNTQVVAAARQRIGELAVRTGTGEGFVGTTGHIRKCVASLRLRIKHQTIWAVLCLYSTVRKSNYNCNVMQ